jgi:hypothetical protein
MTILTLTCAFAGIGENAVPSPVTSRAAAMMAIFMRSPL